MTPRLLPPAVPATTLRVYEPLEAFAVADRPALEVLALTEGAGRRADEAERAASWRAVLAGRDPVAARSDGVTGEPWAARGPESPAAEPLPEAAAPGAHRRRTDGGHPSGRYVAAWVLRHAGVLLVSPVLPPGEEEPAPPTSPRPPRRLVRAWSIPEAWLALVRAEDGERGGGGGRYVVPMSAARSRAARALRTLRLAIGEAEVTAEVEIMARWLEAFHPRACVELDARGLVPLTRGEDGAEDVRLGLECLASGDTTGAAAAYHRLTMRQRLLDDLSRSS